MKYLRTNSEDTRTRECGLSLSSRYQPRRRSSPTRSLMSRKSSLTLTPMNFSRNAWIRNHETPLLSHPRKRKRGFHSRDSQELQARNSSWELKASSLRSRRSSKRNSQRSSRRKRNPRIQSGSGLSIRSLRNHQMLQLLILTTGRGARIVRIPPIVMTQSSGERTYRTISPTGYLI